jgi:hypothetical protein
VTVVVSWSVAILILDTAACETSFNINFLPSLKKRVGKSRRA